MQLEDLHEDYLRRLEPEKHMDYLLTSSVYLLKNDLNGWLKTFNPSCLPIQTSSSPPPVKKRRGAETCSTFNSTPAETKCEECNGTTIDDVTEGHVVCLKCGLIQARPIYMPDAKVPSFSRLCSAVTTVTWTNVNIADTTRTFALIAGVMCAFF